MQVVNSSLSDVASSLQLTYNGYFDGTNWRYLTSSTATNYFQGSGIHAWRTAASGTAGNAITFTQAMTLFSTGNLAVGGTSDNGSRLQVTGAATFSSSITAGGDLTLNPSGNSTITQNASTGNYNQILFKVNGTTQSSILALSNALYFSVNGSSTALTLASNSNVGIGTTSPTVLLDVRSASGANLFNLQASTGTNSVFQTFTNTGGTAYLGTERSTGGNVVSYSQPYESFYATGDNPLLLAVGNSYVRFGTNGSERMRITSGGNVGIGSTNPTVKLQVDNNTHNYFQLNSTVANVQTSISAQNTASGNRATLAWEDGTRGAYGDLYASTFLTLSTGAGEKARLTNAGELLINTTSDAGDYKLQVNGNVRTGGLFDVVAGSTASFALTVDVNSSFAFGSTNGKRTAIIRTTSAEDNGLQFGYDTIDNTGIVAGAGTLNGAGIDFYTYNGTSWGNRMRITKAGNIEANGSIKTAAPSAGNAAAWKLGERVASAGVTFNDQQYIQLDIAGTTYYLATVDLPMPEAYPQATSGPSNNYKITPVQVKTTRDAEIEKLRKEIEELKQLIKNK
jgi:hypothetical protein